MQCRQTASPRKRLCAPVLFRLIVCLSLALWCSGVSLLLCVTPPLPLALVHPHAHPQNEKENKEREEKQLYEGDCSASDIPGVWRQLQAPHVRAKATIFVQRAVSRNSVWRVTVPLLGG